MKLILISSAMLIFSLICLGQESHLSLIYDFEGNDFDYSVKAMVGTNDSLYIISNTPDGHGKFFRIDENGNGYKEIWQFDNVAFMPNSLLANDTVIFGTTMASARGGGALFKYSLKDYKMEFITDFDVKDVRYPQIKFITDSVLWLTSQESVDIDINKYVDHGSIFTIHNDGTHLRKIYNDMNFEKGQHPVDFVFNNDSIYIACFNGGGVYPNSDGTNSETGCFIRIKMDGTGYEMLVKGGLDKGTQPSSIIIRENKLIGLFAYSGDLPKGGQFFRSNFDGTSYDSLGGLSNRSLTRMLSTDSLIYGISCFQIFGLNPFTGEIRIFDDLQSDPDFGYDMVANPAFLKGHVYMSTQQGGPNGGGTILKWTNQIPEINVVNTKSTQKIAQIEFADLNPISLNGNEYITTQQKGASLKLINQDPNNNILNKNSVQNTVQIELRNLFTDPEGDSLTYAFEFDHAAVDLTYSNGTLIVSPLRSGEVEIKVKANDGWGGYNTQTLKIDGSTTGIDQFKNSNISIFPNQDNTVLFINNISQNTTINIIDMQGKSLINERVINNQINISKLLNGVYILQINCDNGIKNQKFIKK